MNSINPIVSISSAHCPPIRRRPPLTVTAASRADNSNNSNHHNNNRGHYAVGKLVDESMIELRLRIHSMKMAEQSHNPPSNWLDWEKRCYSNYDSHICQALGYLQSHLMNTRPSLVFGMLAVLALSVPISSAVVLHSLFQVAVTLLAGTHLS